MLKFLIWRKYLTVWCKYNIITDVVVNHLKRKKIKSSTVDMSEKTCLTFYCLDQKGDEIFSLWDACDFWYTWCATWLVYHVLFPGIPCKLTQQCWASVVYNGPALYQHWLNVLYLQGLGLPPATICSPNYVPMLGQRLWHRFNIETSLV